MNPYLDALEALELELEAEQREPGLLDRIRRRIREWLAGAGGACLGVGAVYIAHAIGLAL
jgi:hypothetical protein